MGSSNLDEWVDWEQKTCHFNDGSFEAVLNLCALGARNEDEIFFEAVPQLSMTQIMMTTPVEMFLDEVSNSGGIQKREYFPLPSSKGYGSMIGSSYYLAVVDKNDLKEVLAEFLAYFFYEEERVTAQDEAMLFSISSKETQAALDELLELENGELRKEFLETALREADRFSYPINAVAEVILDEARRYFAGQITAEKAAEYIQNRVQLYLDEQG